MPLRILHCSLPAKLFIYSRNKSPSGAFVSPRVRECRNVCQERSGNLPSQSASQTALPKGEPRTLRESPCLSLRERWQRRKALTERVPPAPGKRRKPTLFAAIKGSFAETKKMWQNRYKNIAKFIKRITKVWGQLLYKVQKNGTKSAEKRRKSQKVSIWTLAI